MRYYVTKVIPAKNSGLENFKLTSFWAFAQIGRTGEPVWTIISIAATIFGLGTIFCMCCAFVSGVTVLYVAVSFLYFAVSFLYFAVTFFILP